MRTRIKVALTVLLTIALMLLGHLVFILLNLASTPAFLIGLVCLVVALVAVPVPYKFIWRKKTNASQPSTTN